LKLSSARLCETFGFAERFRYGPESNPGGAQLAVGEGSVFLTALRVGQSPKWADRAMFRAPRPDEFTHTVSVHVEDVDAHFQRVKQRGARIFSPPETHPFGERQYTDRPGSDSCHTYDVPLRDSGPMAAGLYISQCCWCGGHNYQCGLLGLIHQRRMPID
jgi:uncharacterized glyoxalase superfamily protein PhnB